MPSAHAMNLFAVSAFFSLLYGRHWLIFLCSAGLVSFTRIYVGVHFPLDVAVGAFAGSLLGFLYGRAAFLLLSRWNISGNEDTKRIYPH
jgi:undecaprenyl-diphosphatase